MCPSLSIHGFIYNILMPIIYLSPHLDDVALSCGGLVWHQVQAGELVEIWTICAGDPPSSDLSPFAAELHTRWELGMDAVAKRREEDQESAKILGAKYKHFDVPDAIYRRDPKSQEILYESFEAILGGVHPGEEMLIQSLVLKIAENLPPGCQLVVPLTLGNHVDHLFTRVLAEWLDLPLTFYADYPYAEKYAKAIPALVPKGFKHTVHSVSENGLKVWQESVAAYESQISTFWPDTAAMRVAIKEYNDTVGGIRIWRA